MKKVDAEKSKIKKLAEIDAVEKIGANIISDYKVLRSHGKNPEPESFWENWTRNHLSKEFPKKYLSPLWKIFVNSLFVKKQDTK